MYDFQNKGFPNTNVKIENIAGVSHDVFSLQSTTIKISRVLSSLNYYY